MSPCLPPYEMERRRLEDANRRLRDHPEDPHAAEPWGRLMADPIDAEPDIAESVHPRETYEHTP